MAKKEKEANNKKGRYFKDMKAELKKVIWPAPKQLANNTLTVIAFTLIIALIVFVLDVCFDAINKHGVVALQQKVTSSFNANKNNEENTTAENNTTADNNTSTGEENATGNSGDNSVKVEAETTTETNNETENDNNSTNTEIKK